MIRISHLVLWGAAAALALGSCRSSPEQPRDARRARARVSAAAYERVPRYLEAPGSVRARNRMALASQIHGTVREVRVRVGDTTAPGQTLMLLDDREVESGKASAAASVREAQAGLEEARKGIVIAESMLQASRASARLAGQTLARYRKLEEARSVSPQELDEVRMRNDAAAAELAAKETMLAAARDRLAQAEARHAQAASEEQRSEVVLGYSVVRAPAAGRVVEKHADPGTAIFPGSPLLVLESAARPQVVADLPSAESRHLKPGLQVRVRASDTPGGGVSGQISEIVPLSDSAAHTVRFKVDLPPDFSGSPGQFVTVEVPAGLRQALLVAREAVRATGQLTGVFVADADSIARYRLVRLTAYDSGRMEVLAGVQEGERIVTGLTEEVSDGIRLEIQP